MRSLGVHSVYVLDDLEPVRRPARPTLVAGDAEQAGINVPPTTALHHRRDEFAGEVEKIIKSGAGAVFLAGDGGAGDRRACGAHCTPPTRSLWLLGSSAMAEETFTHSLGAAEDGTYLTTPAAVGDYPPSARSVLADYRRTSVCDAGP